MRHLLIHWLLSATGLLLVSHIVPGFEVSGFLAALLAAVVFGLINSTLGLILKILTFPLTIVTLGLFWLVLNALMLELASWLAPGFQIRSFGAALLGALVLAVVNLLLRYLVLKD